MRFSENWLREWVDPGVRRDELCLRLDMLGLEVESVTELGAGLEHIVVGQIIAAAPHPDADRLQVCRVDIGDSEPLQIVCGAANARVGLKAPLAKIGAQVGSLSIQAASLRGVESTGMLCSARELGLDDDASGLMELPADAAVGAPLAQFLGLPDASIELGLTPNRADCLGMLGLASDIAAAFDQPLTVPGGADGQAVAATIQDTRQVNLAAGADCPRYLCRVIDGVDASAPSPIWLSERLRRAGIRPVSAIVDVTSYVMLELGQPLHAFDQDRLQGAISVRHGRPKEALTLLDGSDVVIDEDFLVIADEAGAIALAGIMGGQESRVTDASSRILLESAHFRPAAIIGRARRLGLHTDASHRYERGVDPDLPRRAMERATALLLAIVGGQAGPVVEACDPAALPARKPVHLRQARIARLLGIDIPAARVAAILAGLDMQVQADADGQGWQVTPPSRRFDIAIEEDLIEEVARIHGYDQVPVRAPAGELAPTQPSEARLPDTRLRHALAARGWQEALTFAFVEHELLATWHLADGAIRLANPLSAELAVMRTRLLPGLVQALAYNRARQMPRLRLFELGRRFCLDGDQVRETDSLALAGCGPALAEHWQHQPARDFDFHDLKGELQALTGLGGEPAAWQFTATDQVPWLHPGRAATILHQGQPVGVIGSLHPSLLKALDLDEDVQVAEVDLDALRQAKVPRAQALSRYPQVRRDLALVVAADVPWQAIADAVRQAVGEDLEQLLVFDEYRGQGVGEGFKSLAMGLILRNPSRTLVDADADQAVARALAAVGEHFQAQLRS
ncbi:MAG: phenylalanine--tRNA ligase subunit beta [Xanthomonadales bacterium]|nr:phenylalanine--tRNA ligase subunit beta [Xanthomonadales bacterium]